LSTATDKVGADAPKSVSRPEKERRETVSSTRMVASAELKSLASSGGSHANASVLAAESSMAAPLPKTKALAPATITSTQLRTRRDHPGISYFDLPRDPENSFIRLEKVLIHRKDPRSLNAVS